LIWGDILYPRTILLLWNIFCIDLGKYCIPSPRTILLLGNIWCTNLGKYSFSQKYPLIREYLVYWLGEISPLPELSSYWGISCVLTIWEIFPLPQLHIFLLEIPCVLPWVNIVFPRTILFLWNILWIDLGKYTFSQNYPLIREYLVYWQGEIFPLQEHFSYWGMSGVLTRVKVPPPRTILLLPLLGNIWCID
jgi:hypothetical protein